MTLEEYHSTLLDLMARACHYAQGHCGDPDAWPSDSSDREQYLTCTSYQMACFLSQNTVNGHKGVESNVILDKLTTSTLDKNGMMCKSIKEWEDILNGIAEELGGWE